MPHNLHEALYLDVLKAGKDLLAEKPFGIDLKAARAIAAAAKASGRFVRCSSEFPFLPGAQRAYQIAREGKLGKLLEIRSGFHHSSDLDPTKPVNWKRQVKTCGEIGVMGDLGMHTVHVPFRLGWKPKRVYAQLQKIYHERPDGKGGMAPCDTWDNALLHTEVEIDGAEVPMRFEMKRLAPGETNTWFIEILGTDGGVQLQHQGAEDALDLPARQGTDLAADRPRLSRALSRPSPAAFSSPAFPIASCKCGPLSWPSAPGNSTAASAASRRRKRCEATNFSPPRCSRMPKKKPSIFHEAGPR